MDNTSTCLSTVSQVVLDETCVSTVSDYVLDETCVEWWS